MGSKMGWIIGGIVGVFLLAAILYAFLWPNPSPPTRLTLAPGRLKMLSPEKPLTFLMPAAPSAAGDAGDDYKRALDLYAANREAVNGVATKMDEVRGGKPLSPAEMAVIQPIVDAVAAGAAKAKMTYYGRVIPVDIGFPPEPKFADQMQDLAGVIRLACFQGYAGGDSHYAEAERRLFDMLVMGQHMIDERARLSIVQRGIGIQRDACTWLKALYTKWGKPDRVELAAEYISGLSHMSNTYDDFNKILIHAANPKAGDVWNLAINHEDPAVRAEGVLGSGVVKLVPKKKWDKRRAEQTIQQAAASSNPTMREAARWARELDWAGVERLSSEF